MEEVMKRHDQLAKAYERLTYTTQRFLALTQDVRYHKRHALAQENEFVDCRDILIKRFEICYELTWKFYKTLLRERFSIEVANPRATFQECYRQQLITQQQVDALMSMIRARNEATHIYDEELAEQLSHRIPHYTEVLTSLLSQMKEKGVLPS